MEKVMRVFFPLLAIACLTPWVSSSLALVLGILVALTLGNPYAARVRKGTPLLLQAAVVGLGAGMNLNAVIKTGAEGFTYTAVGITLTMIVGVFLGKLLSIQRVTSLLITVGTAICGGSAIAATGATLKAKQEEMSVALGTVFLLNALALIVFPWLGSQFSLDPHQFGLWCALAIHDTSSVVGAALAYGHGAIDVAAPIKLSRALWILPLTTVIAVWQARREKTEAASPGGTPASAAKRPWFILWFIVMAALVTWIPMLQEPGMWVATGARRLMVLVLFFIGSALTPSALKNVGIRPFFQGVALWVLVTAVTLGAILRGWIG